MLDLRGALAAVPFYVVRRYQLWRLVLAPCVGNSLLGSIVALFVVGDGVGPRLEQSLGSVRMVWLVLSATPAIFGGFCLLCYVAALAGHPTAVLADASGCWGLVLALVTLECLSAPEATRRLLCRSRAASCLLAPTTRRPSKG